MIEKKFLEFKKSASNVELNDIDFLVAKAEQLEASEPELSKKILIEVNNLKAEKKGVQKKSPNANEVTHPLLKEDQISKRVIVKTKKTVQFFFHSPQKFARRFVEKVTQLRIAKALFQSPFITLVVLPSVLFSGYQLLWATERYESQAQVIVQQPDGMATMDASMALLTGLGVSNTGVSDTELVKAYIYSNDMLHYLDSKLDLRSHYSESSVDLFSRMKKDESKEGFLAFYQKHVDVYIESKSQVVYIYSQGFEPDFAHKLTQTIVDRSEWFINSIGHQLAEAQLEFIKKEHQIVEDKLETAQRKLLQFQQRYNLLDPTAEGLAMQQITYTLEGQITAKEAELKGFSSIMSATAPQVVRTTNELNALKAQLKRERSKLSDESGINIPVSEILANFTDLKIKMELALQAYTSSQVSLEKSRIEAYRQLKYLVVVESATQPEENKYPYVFYNVSLFVLISIMLFAVGRIVYSTVRELK
ncbi:lipopolysaccharide biosynthesis protein [uncultured Vibrio sp.]|uniref:lipopolysaccharide biosynthesis protein n=1 Tax=uncultured Vibrio sp. TaxID=114054 RepID=UPI00091E8607|nr:lipopolysaccharide biosynthesis protein [uncultured Vibrio sp.]OIQ25365.1 MAG: lipopolysaccharide biosynthesis protein [Vibrio sp. MedPE-SWchi]